MGSNLQNNLFIIIERMWLAGAAFGVIFTVYFLIQKDNDSALYFFAFFILSGLFYILRKKQRKKQEAHLADKKKNQR